MPVIIMIMGFLFMLHRQTHTHTCVDIMVFLDGPARMIPDQAKDFYT